MSSLTSFTTDKSILKEIEECNKIILSDEEHLRNTYDILRYISNTPIVDFDNNFTFFLKTKLPHKTEWISRVLHNTSGKGKYTTTWYINGLRYTGNIHNMIYHYFSHETIERGYVIHYIDGNPFNNIYPNLIKLTRKEHTGYHIFINKYNLECNIQTLNRYRKYITTKKQETV